MSCKISSERISFRGKENVMRESIMAEAALSVLLSYTPSNYISQIVPQLLLVTFSGRVFNNAKYTFSYLFFPLCLPFINLLNTIKQRVYVMCSFAQKGPNKIKNTKPSLWNEEWSYKQTSGIMSDASSLKGRLVSKCRRSSFVSPTYFLYLSSGSTWIICMPFNLKKRKYGKKSWAKH